VKFDRNSAQPWGQYFSDLVPRFASTGKGLSAIQCGNIAGDCFGGADGKQDFVHATQAATLVVDNPNCTAQSATASMGFFLSLFAEKCRADLRQPNSKVADLIATMRSRDLPLDPFINAGLIPRPQAVANNNRRRTRGPQTAGSAPENLRGPEVTNFDRHDQDDTSRRIAPADFKTENTRPKSTNNSGADPFSLLDKPPDLRPAKPKQTEAEATRDREIARQYVVQGQYDAALSMYDQAVARDPQDYKAWNNRAWFRATCPDARYRDGKLAVGDALQACQLTKRQNPDMLDTLAAAYAEMGSFNEAIKVQNEALRLPASNQQQAAMRSRLALYKASTPYHETAGR
jgi:tetratricopeptide (TPR) repeat protein